MKTEAKSPISLATMLGMGDDFQAKDKNYVIKPIALKHINEFIDDNLSLTTQLFTIYNAESKSKIEKWMAGYCFDVKGEPMSVEKAIADDWDIVDLKNFIKRLCDLSG